MPLICFNVLGIKEWAAVALVGERAPMGLAVLVRVQLDQTSIALGVLATSEVSESFLGGDPVAIGRLPVARTRVRVVGGASRNQEYEVLVAHAEKPSRLVRACQGPDRDQMPTLSNPYGLLLPVGHKRKQPSQREGCLISTATSFTSKERNVDRSPTCCGLGLTLAKLRQA